MVKTTVYLPEELEVKLDAEAAATGVSKAELIRRGIALLLESSIRPKQSRALPVFDSGRPMTADAMDDALYAHIKERAARR
jgi:Arc/MetJ-type ribon-helix-helix transcriptional regulator